MFSTVTWFSNVVTAHASLSGIINFFYDPTFQPAGKDYFIRLLIFHTIIGIFIQLPMIFFFVRIGFLAKVGILKCFDKLFGRIYSWCGSIILIAEISNLLTFLMSTDIRMEIIELLPYQGSYDSHNDCMNYITLLICIIISPILSTNYKNQLSFLYITFLFHLFGLIWILTEYTRIPTLKVPSASIIDDLKLIIKYDIKEEYSPNLYLGIFNLLSGATWVYIGSQLPKKTNNYTILFILMSSIFFDIFEKITNCLMMMRIHKIPKRQIFGTRMSLLELTCYSEIVKQTNSPFHSFNFAFVLAFFWYFCMLIRKFVILGNIIKRSSDRKIWGAKESLMYVSLIFLICNLRTNDTFFGGILSKESTFLYAFSSLALGTILLVKRNRIDTIIAIFGINSWPLWKYLKYVIASIILFLISIPLQVWYILTVMKYILESKDSILMRLYALISVFVISMVLNWLDV